MDILSVLNTLGLDKDEVEVTSNTSRRKKQAFEGENSSPRNPRFQTYEEQPCTISDQDFEQEFRKEPREAPRNRFTNHLEALEHDIECVRSENAAHKSMNDRLKREVEGIRLELQLKQEELSNVKKGLDVSEQTRNDVEHNLKLARQEAARLKYRENEIRDERQSMERNYESRIDELLKELSTTRQAFHSAQEVILVQERGAQDQEKIKNSLDTSSKHLQSELDACRRKLTCLEREGALKKKKESLARHSREAEKRDLKESLGEANEAIRCLKAQVDQLQKRNLVLKRESSKVASQVENMNQIVIDAKQVATSEKESMINKEDVLNARVKEASHKMSELQRKHDAEIAMLRQTVENYQNDLNAAQEEHLRIEQKNRKYLLEKKQELDLANDQVSILRERLATQGTDSEGSGRVLAIEESNRLISIITAKDEAMAEIDERITSLKQELAMKDEQVEGYTTSQKEYERRTHAAEALAQHQVEINLVLRESMRKEKVKLIAAKEKAEAQHRSLIARFRDDVRNSVSELESIKAIRAIESAGRSTEMDKITKASLLSKVMRLEAELEIRDQKMQAFKTPLQGAGLEYSRAHDNEDDE